MALYALRDFARHPPPLVGTAGTLVQNAHSIAVFDAFPKAKYHFLVLPRLPFAAPGYEDVGDRDLASLSALLRHKARGAVLAEMERTAEDVLEMVRDEMVKTEGFQWGINVGFHAVPSMHHLHLHIISDDLLTLTFKTKKHYNSFRPDLGFFVPLREVKGWLEEGEDQILRRAESLHAKEELLKTPLTCFKCGEAMGNMPLLKRHLEEEFATEAKSAARQR